MRFFFSFAGINCLTMMFLIFVFKSSMFTRFVLSLFTSSSFTSFFTGHLDNNVATRFLVLANCLSLALEIVVIFCMVFLPSM